MRAPKHLWSGDWERESAAVSEDLAALEELPRVSPAQEESAPRPVTRRATALSAAPATASAEARGRTTTPHPEPAGEPSRIKPPIRWPQIRIPPLSPRARRAAALTVALMVVAAAGAYGLVALLGSSGSAGSAAANGQAAPMSWLGMEVATVGPGRVVVETVASGSQGERSGFEPGDVLLAIDSRSLVSTADISKAIFGMRSGDEVQIEVGRGSAVFVTSATLAAAPVKYP